MAVITGISFVFICFGLGIFMGWLDERKWTAPERAIKEFIKEFEQKRRKLN